MRTRMTKDLLQGLLAYPIPAYDSRSTKPSKKRRFYQTINQMKSVNRISRRSRHSDNKKEPHSLNKEEAWHTLRRLKNL